MYVVYVYVCMYVCMYVCRLAGQVGWLASIAPDSIKSRIQASEQRIGIVETAQVRSPHTQICIAEIFIIICMYVCMYVVYLLLCTYVIIITGHVLFFKNVCALLEIITFLYVYMCVCMYILMYVYTYVCLYVCGRVYTGYVDCVDSLWVWKWPSCERSLRTRRCSWATS